MHDKLTPKPSQMVGAPTASWSVILPYYNELDYLPDSLASIIAQEYRPFRLILVDNGSTDGSAELCRKMCDGHEGVDILHLYEARPGKIHALEQAIAAANTTFVATCDADTYYPPHYLQLCNTLFATGSADTVAVIAVHTAADPYNLFARLLRQTRVFTSRILDRQAHMGGFGQSFRTAALKKVGGYSESLWPYILLDHEIMHRLFMIGTSRYDHNLWCIASRRRSDRKSVRWNLTERQLYHFTPFALKDWYFYRFLASRLARRDLDHLRLRHQPWQADGAAGSEALAPRRQRGRRKKL